MLLIVRCRLRYARCLLAVFALAEPLSHS